MVFQVLDRSNRVYNITGLQNIWWKVKAHRFPRHATIDINVIDVNQLTNGGAAANARMQRSVP
jgi:hypothetical protein